jgi:NAD-dependent deacetylase
MRCKRAYDPAAAAKLTKDDIPWLCTSCSGLIRPEVVFFGEMIPQEAMRRTGEAVNDADLVLIVGTSGEVAPANLIPRQVNLGPTAFGGVSDVRFDAPAEVVLPALAERVCGETGTAAGKRPK